MSTLPGRSLGSTGMTITVLGIGAWAIGGGGWVFGWGPQDDQDSVRTIRHAVDSGINWIDTAAVYGFGHSEEVVGRAVRSLPESDRPYIFTKCGMVWDDADRTKPPQKRGRAASIRSECEASLKRLGVERIDLLQLHWPPKDGSTADEFWGTLLELKQEGKIRAAGVSNVRLGPLSALEPIGHVDTLQPPLSLINRAALDDLLPWCEQNGTGVIAYSPMQSGLLTGRWSTQRVAELPADDWRHSAPDFTIGLVRNLRLADALEPIAERHGTTPAAIALAWVIAQPGVTAAIVGARRPEQIDEWMPGASIQLTNQDGDALSEALANFERQGANT
jgi:aryl-alcohol dehydrogenase-like predicted oxidoreductase